jgi:hypothetical protein
MAGGQDFLQPRKESRIMIMQDALLASEAGWRLWQATHGHFGAFRQVVRSATATFDFRWAGELIRDVVSEMWLRDGSATAYFSQVVLARLLGRQGYLSSAATGLIGERVKREDGKLALDYELVAPGGLDRKTRYVFDSHVFERNVLPDDKRAIQEMGDLLSQLFTLGIQGSNRANLNGCVVTRIGNTTKATSISEMWHVHRLGLAGADQPRQTASCISPCEMRQFLRRPRLGRGPKGETGPARSW